MNKTYKVNVNKTFEFDFTDEDISKLDSIKISNDSFHVLHNNSSHSVTFLSSDFNHKIYKVIVDNNEFNINIISDLDILIKDMGFEVGATKKVNEIKAPMPGLILEINVKEGQEIKEDDQVLILEAMKMENVISSPRDGKIKSISAMQGDAVEKNQLLIEFE
jgi:biotin carboxyl carrier protein